jgi:hypothetical protein
MAGPRAWAPTATRGVSAADLQGRGLRLLRSHAGGGGPLIASVLSRAMLVVRANQIAAGGSGALRLRRIRPGGPSLAAAFGLAAGVLPASTADRPLDSDLGAAQSVLARLAEFAGSA